MSVVLLTGATGFVGRAIHRYLHRRGHQVRVTVRSGSAERLAAPVSFDAMIETDDIFARDARWWEDACEGVDAVIHAAWYVEHGLYPNAPENADCVRGSFALAQGAVQAGVNHVIGIGTCWEYRLPGEALTVDSPLDPVNFYAACKLSAYHMMREWLALHDTRISWCRLFYLHGEGEHPDRLGAYLHRRLGAGETASLSAGTQLRDFLDVRDAGAMIASVVDSGQCGTINICSGQPVTIRAFAEAIADRYGRRDLLQFGSQPLRPSDPQAVVGVCNLQRAPELLQP
ncbi:NAD-dependent epimerase/dehydratase family protein [Novosphingobium album (ex Hu et al. 2023)]|uniref:NAD(P)-dependent oxidoreductase n=1 Tax=Novosphingobium album (ex Hu et al. 2023) TaxID=2930093 RepID=A0ABT0B2T6_9SPHN|nr:NAD(P)-dependent oxidoreductase [Novosphingobium album (ex Hu et al. 2023)]MCJ2179350.1 NAD(P)-dependent oxidoreductase [Novosphingobium album (ex Hu et al. 2023)]